MVPVRRILKRLFIASCHPTPKATPGIELSHSADETHPHLAYLTRLHRAFSMRCTASLQVGTINCSPRHDDELDLHIKTLTPGVPAYFSAVVALINRRGSAFSVVRDDPAHKVADGQRDGGNIAT